MTIGISLAHGIAKRNIREHQQDCDMAAIKSRSFKPGKFSRAAVYRANIKTVKEIYKNTIYWTEQRGNGRGKKKDEFFRIRFTDTTTDEVTGKNYIGYFYVEILAKHPNIDNTPLFVMSEHTLARINQTYGVEYHDIPSRLEDDMAGLEHLALHYKNKPWDRNKSFAYITEMGALICVYDTSLRMLNAKTMISYDSMNSPTQRKFQKAADNGEYWIEWKNHKLND